MQNESVQHQDPARGPDLGQGADLAMARLHGLACVTDRTGRPLQLGQDLRRLILADEAEMPTSLLDLVAVQGRPGLRDALDALASDAAPQTLELPLRTPAGLRWCAFEVSAQPALGGGTPTLLWRGTDIHRRQPLPTVIPAKAGIQGLSRVGSRRWVPAFAGTTGWVSSGRKV
ncbi:hypothetical protein [Pseudoxanthomonas winnipegensis]|uniref:hypothetical protein n=1 Tax=Pseudoxanthomonas winnipegensis TaxID=2480810 RepID=UPI0013EE44CE|nr:hypothetical protein [Pseudoxanthomonas winnipegensis]